MTSEFGQVDENKGVDSTEQMESTESSGSEHGSFGEQGGQGGSDDWSQTYTVEEGDTLTSIAERFYGDGNAYNRIWEANREKLDNPDVIQPGQELNIPR
jgi:nucleoid-associated protein YgaU